MKRRVVAAIGGAMTLALLASAQVGASAGSSGGTRAWERSYGDGQPASGSHMVVSADGRTVFVSGARKRDATTTSIVALAYDAATGERQWVSTWTPNRDGEHGNGTRLTLSPDESVVFVAGRTSCRGSCEGGDTFTTIAFDAVTGERLWVSRVPNDDGRPSNVVVTPDGSKVVVYGGAVFFDRGRTFALDALNGETVWTQDHPYSVAWDHGLALSSDGTTAYVVGTDFQTNGCPRFDAVLVAYDVTTGAERARHHVACTYATAVEVTPDGSRVVVGGATDSFPRGIVATSIDPVSGARDWSTMFPGPEWSGESSPDMVMTPDGSQVVISSPERAPSQLFGARTVAVDVASGEIRWDRFFEGTGFVTPGRLATTADGSTVFVTAADRSNCYAQECDPREIQRALVLAYDAKTGDQRWVSTYPGGALSAIAASPAGSRVYLAGYLVPDSASAGRLRARGTCTSTACGIASVAYNNRVAAYRTEDSDVGVRWSGWTGRFVEGALGGADRISRTRGAVITYAGPARSIVRWMTRVGPTMGVARLVIDGRLVGTYDLYAERVARRVIKIEGLAEKRHRVQVVVTGRRNPASRGSWVVADAFAYNPRGDTKQEYTPQVNPGSWRMLQSLAASGGSLRVSKSRDDRATLTFRGGTVRFVTARGPAYGKARVVVDGRARRVNLYSAKRQWQVPIVFTGLGKGTHTITVRPLGIKDARSRGKAVVVDAFVVRP